ncbi:MAG: glycosyltransferase family 2 protein [Limisphaerales bacterium]
MTRVSVILPFFNSERYLAEALESIRRQSFSDFELLLINDGSSDHSADIAQEMASKDSRIVLLHGDHRGGAQCRNDGISMAKGELIAMMDSDDVAEAERLAHQVRFLESNPECCAVGTQAIRIDPDGWAINTWRVPEEHEEIDNSHMRGISGQIIHPSVMMRKSFVQRVGGYRPGVAEDYDLFLRLAEIGRLANLPQALMQYRLHTKSTTLGSAYSVWCSARKALEEAWIRRGRADSPPHCQPAPVQQSEEDLAWCWAREAFASQYFGTARKHAYRLVWKRPSDFKRWVLFAAACAGPVAFRAKCVFPYRLGH